MTSDILIRLVNANEVGHLREISEATFRETFAAQNTKENLEAYLSKSFSMAAVQAQFDDLNTDFYFAHQDKEVLGYLKLNHEEDRVEIERIYVPRTFQGRKIGKALFEFALQTAKSRHVEWLWLGVWQENKKAVAFYTAHGLEIFGHRKFKLGEGLQNDFLMRLRIP